MTAPSSVRSSRTFDGSAVAVATSVMNLATYGFTMLAARILGPGQYGAFVACLSLLIVVQVLALGLQATAARRIAVDQTNVGAIERAILTLTTRVSLAIGLVMCLLIPAINALLNLDSLATATVVALSTVPLTLAGGQAGILQGERRWGALAVFYLAGGIPRLLIGLAIILWRPDATSAILGVGLGYLFPLLVGWWVLRDRRTPEAVAPEHSARSLLVESAHNAQVLLAYFALTSVDIILARQVLSEHDAGLYAAGLIMAKVMIFLPQFIVVIAFPDMATPEGRHRALVRSLVAVAVLGVLAIGAAKVLSGVAMIFVGGSEFGEVEDLLWQFALLGTLLAMLQLQVYAVLARQARRSVLLVWAALAAIIVLGLGADSVAGLVRVVVGVDAVLLLALTVASLRLAKQADPGAASVGGVVPAAPGTD
ncbi:Membrane protein involved in the export of O-antigen and teichoic acid [Nocardioides alpinus]|uniref:Membrane protein involved in the export of O-antigen and teichoic acid n=1 Tax=Nocardioides alpinus TaxID=748909 RepID=A0A1I1B7A3_9ACTN|nr:oligosaccharide flippase family protein [Nocardioides alpinus]PKH41364.1 polysaccharide biosynthesis protein [Nocardioides alpinus]SFB45546.1 Membrane protein involved in the export of O-antigen and teichoic acid [Nocardioides alpinus]